MPDHEPSPFARLWMLDPSVAYLNHGSFGACPRAILDHQTLLRAEMEKEPADFLARTLPARLFEARSAAAAFVGASADDVTFVTNATSGVNAIVRSLPLEPGDELLTTDHAYGACRRTLDYVARERKARVVTAAIPFPLVGPEQVVEAVLGAATARTRLALIDHVTSPTGLVFPVERIVQELAGRGIDTLVDGAHALGMLPLALDRLAAAYYTANAHKWLCAPKGAAILHVRRDRQRLVHPLTISHGYDPASAAARFREEFDWTGTEDPTGFLSIPECIRYLGSLLSGGWPALMERNRALALSARGVLCEGLGIAPPAPESMIANLVALPLPTAAPGSPAAALDHVAFGRWLRDRGTDPVVFAWPEAKSRILRISAQLY